MARSVKRVPDPSNPILIRLMDGQKLAQVLGGVDGDRASELAFMRGQESSMRQFWKETENDDL